jgi:hypothetical protein
MRPPRENAEVGIPLAIVLWLVTCGIYGLVWQNKIFETTNQLLGEDKFSFWPWLGLSIITCGIYNFYAQYQLGEALNQALIKEGRPPNTSLSALALILSIFGLLVIVHAIEQAEINKLYVV